MPNYDIFFDNTHSPQAERFLRFLNRQLFRFLRRRMGAVAPSLLEIGPGKGYFYQAVQAHGGCRYMACDQNATFHERFPEAAFRCASAPALPALPEPVDLVYAAYVIEHLEDGPAVASLARAARSALKPGGLLVLLCPDALRQREEFWNMDYTHRYPTTARNVTMALRDSGYEDIEIYPIHGLLTVAGFDTRAWRWGAGAILFFYRYRLFQALFGWLFGVPDHALENPWYRGYCLIKQPNLLILARRD